MEENISKTGTSVSSDPIGAVMVVGAGIAGIQTALDLANLGFKVYLVEREPAIGGKMAQLDKTFPTNDCSMCILSPKLIECERNTNIEIITLAEVKEIAGNPGRFKVTLLKKPRYVDEELCTNCGQCTPYCPLPVLDTYNESLSEVRNLHIHFPQAIPAVPYIDRTKCLFLTMDVCHICTSACQRKAIDLTQKEQLLELDVGAVILALGFETFDPHLKPEYGYGRYANVITSLEYERILSAGGPTVGHIRRPFDGKEPRKIAWIQCVGSRDATLGCEYCSYVCCMYATKQAIISREHDQEIEPTIFYIDMRAPGKGFERYYHRARTTGGVRYERSMISRVLENPQTHDLELTYVNELGEMQTETFDMVILSVGLRPHPAFLELAQRLGIELNRFGFCESQPLDTVSTSIPGIFACGVIQGPNDIPISVLDGSSAAAAVAGLLSATRGTLVEEKTYPEERDITEEEPRIGVFLCDCGINIAGVIDVAEVTEYAKTLPHVVFAHEHLFACSTDTQEEIKAVIDEHRLNRIVVAACTPRTHEPLFQDTIREAGLNKYLVDMANVRDQGSWVHSSDPERATAKAKDLVRMAVARASRLEPLSDFPFAVIQKGLVIGGGLAGMTAALTLAEAGFETYLVEQTHQLGGNARTLYYTEDGARPADHVEKLIKKVEAHPLITIHIGAEVRDFSGHLGRFTSAISKDGGLEQIEYGAVILATGGTEYQPREYLYGQNDHVITQKELERRIALEPDTLKGYSNVVMIQCVGCMDEDHPYCSRVCCTGAVKNSLKLKELNPEINIYVLYQDMRTFSFKELFYKKAREQGVRFLRYLLRQKPAVTEVNGQLQVKVFHQNLRSEVLLKPDLLVLSAAIRPHPGSKQMAEVFKLPLDQDGFFAEAHLKLRPVDFANAGMFLCGLAHGPKFADEAIAQAKAAAAKAAAIISQESMVTQGVVARVDEEMCVGCGLCVALCPFEALKIVETEQGRRVQVIDAACMGCGVCAATCYRHAIGINAFTDEQIGSQVRAFLGG